MATAPKILFAAGIALLALLMARSLSAPERSVPAPGAGAGTETAKAFDEVTEPGANDPALDQGRQVAPLPASRPLPAGLLVRVTWADGSPAAGVGLRIREEECAPLGRQVRTGGDGAARLTGLCGGDVLVRTDRPGLSGSTTLLPGRTTELTLQVPAGIDVDGIVVDRQGHPVAGAEVLLSYLGLLPQTTTVAAHAAADGTFTLRSLHRYNLVGARAAGRGTCLFEWPGRRGDRPGGRLALRLVLPGPGAALSGCVLGPDGRPVPEAFVRLGGPGPPRPRRSADGIAMEPPPRHLTADAQGRFAASDLPGGRLDVRAWSPGLAPADASVELAAGSELALTLQLSAPAVLVGTVTGTDGAAVPGITVELEGYDYPGPRWATSGSDGGFRIEGLPAGIHAVRAVAAEAGRARAELPLAAGRETRWHCRLDTAVRIDGTLVDHRNEPIAGWLVRERRGGSSAWTGARGTFTLTNLGPVPEDGAGHRLWIHDNGGEPATLVVDGVQPGVRTITVPEQARLRSTLHGRALDTDGRPVAGAVVSLFQGTLPVAGAASSDPCTGEFTTRELPPGTYQLQITAPGCEPFALEPVEVLPGAGGELGELRLRRR